MATYDAFATEYSLSMGEDGDYFHKTQIDPHIFTILGKLKGKRVYDLGSGNGYLSRKMTKLGAQVVASDESELLISIAESMNAKKEILYSVHDGADFSRYKKGQFDAVVMNMVIHHIRDLSVLMKGIATVLKPGGILAFSMPHPMRPMHPYAEWVKGEVNGRAKLFVKLTGYLKEEARTASSGFDEITELKLYNRPLSRYVESMAQSGLYIFHLAEPESVGFAKNFPDEIKNTSHIPTFMIVGVKKI